MISGDDDSSMRKKQTIMRWDAKKKKYVKDQDEGKDIFLTKVSRNCQNV